MFLNTRLRNVEHEKPAYSGKQWVESRQFLELPQMLCHHPVLIREPAELDTHCKSSTYTWYLLGMCLSHACTCASVIFGMCLLHIPLMLTLDMASAWRRMAKAWHMLNVCSCVLGDQNFIKCEIRRYTNNNFENMNNTKRLL